MVDDDRDENLDLGKGPCRIGHPGIAVVVYRLENARWEPKACAGADLQLELARPHLHAEEEAGRRGAAKNEGETIESDNPEDDLFRHGEPELELAAGWGIEPLLGVAGNKNLREQRNEVAAGIQSIEGELLEPESLGQW